ncbi:hypothetical protein [Actibacterium sp.]|uniref:hypothetical protein n=1 Tax=Actibacterium sp. TaxID=1872125 RepID=UPI003566E45C
MFAGLFKPAGVKRQQQELAAYADSLKGLTPKEVALTLLLATQIRWQLNEVGVDVMRPAAALQADRALVKKSEAEVRRFQKDKKMHDAAGMAVWMHTLRAAQHPALRDDARRMWAELARGMPKVSDWAQELFLETGEALEWRGHDMFPQGMAPDHPHHNINTGAMVSAHDTDVTID